MSNIEEEKKNLDKDPNSVESVKSPELVPKQNRIIK